MHPAARRQHLIVRPCSEDVQVRINGTELTQILLNLAINACQCKPQLHEVRLQGILLSELPPTAQRPDGPEDLVLNREALIGGGSWLALAVSDNGPGIAPEIVSKIFEPYFTTKGPGQGTGLGLSIVLRLVKAAQGAIHVHTRLGQGSTFTVYLPALVDGTRS
jgi:signal transduction histidine kinase